MAISAETFSSFIHLETLNLRYNRLGEINGNMCIGLQSLKYLDLSWNSPLKISRHGFSHMPSLETLNLNRSSFTTLMSDVFNPDDYPDSYGRPRRLELSLANIYRCQCNASLCWLKDALEDGSVIFPIGGLPTCHNLAKIPFDVVTLDCTAGKYCFLRLLNI